MSNPNSSSDPSGLSQQGINTVFVFAWAVCAIFYFIQYVLRSAPGIMIPEMSVTLHTDRSTLAGVIGIYFYSYALFSLFSGILLDRVGPRFSATFGIILVALGAVLFGSGLMSGAAIGRFLQGAGSGLAFTSAVFLAARGFPKVWLATAVGVTQCFGMLGGFMGQAVVSPVIKNGLVSWQVFWFIAAAALVIVCMAMLAITPRTRIGKVDWSGLGRPYMTVLKNPQSYLCAIIAALMFMPTNIADFVWGTSFIVDALGDKPADAATLVAMVPLGWVIGCPLLGYVSDFFGRRKPVLLVSLLVMMVGAYFMVYFPHAGHLGLYDGSQPYVLSLLFGVASGAAMIPYTMIKEVNPDEVKGTATGIINFIVFVTSAIMTNVFGSIIRALAEDSEHPSLSDFQHADLLFVASLALAFILALFFLKETGSGKTPEVPVIPE